MLVRPLLNINNHQLSMAYVSLKRTRNYKTRPGPIDGVVDRLCHMVPLSYINDHQLVSPSGLTPSGSRLGLHINGNNSWITPYC